MGKTVAIANQKGGVGKTTTAVNLCASLSYRGRRVLLVDCDPQGNATTAFGLDKSEVKSVYNVLLGEMPARDAVTQSRFGSIIGAGPDLAGANIELVDVPGREFVLMHKLKSLKGLFDFIFIDCPPSLELLTINALTCATGVLIPVQCEYYALEGIADLVRSIKMCNRGLNPGLGIEGIVMTMYDGRTKLSDQVVTEVRRFFGKKVYKTMIPRNVRLSEAPSHRKPAIAYDKESKGSRAYLHLASEMLKREEKAEKKRAEAEDTNGEG